jgi:tRNA(Ile)-lysidine synthase
MTSGAADLVGVVAAAMPTGSAVVALSGGADSAVVAWALTQIEGRGPVRAVHVHHGMPDADNLATAAERVAAVLDLRLTRVSVEIPAGPSLEGQARLARLQALEAEAASDEWIVTGHHADDAIETVIGNLMRGAGATGLSGMQTRRDRWVRPLLPIPRFDVRRAAAELDLPYVDDPANEERRHRRNIIRLDVVPLLEERLPGHDLRAAVARSAAALARDDAALNSAAGSMALIRGDGAILAPAAVISTADPAVAARMARRALRLARPPYAGSSADVDAVVAVAAGDHLRQGLTGGWFVEREGAMVAIYRTEPEATSSAVPLAVGGRADFAGFGVLAEVVESPAGYRPIGRWRVRLSRGAIGSELVVRVAEPGERIDLGGGSKAVRDAMGEAGVPRRLRAAWPVVAAPARIAWLVGVRTAAWARPGSAKASAMVELSATKGTTP